MHSQLERNVHGSLLLSIALLCYGGGASGVGLVTFMNGALDKLRGKRQRTFLNRYIWSYISYDKSFSGGR